MNGKAILVLVLALFSSSSYATITVTGESGAGLLSTYYQIIPNPSAGNSDVYLHELYNPGVFTT